MIDIKRKPSEERVWGKYYPEQAKKFDFPKMNVYDLVYEENKKRKDSIALEYEGTQIRYGDFFDKVEEKTEFFLNKQLNPNDVATITMLMAPEFVCDWYALSRLHVLSNLIDPRTSADGVREYLEEANSKIILNTNIFTSKVRQAMGTMPTNVINYSLRDSATRMPFTLGAISLITGLSSDMIARKDTRFNRYMPSNEKQHFGNLPLYQKDQPLTIVHTGGTTGIPKGVVLSHDNYNAMAWEYKTSGIGFSHDQGFLLVMPPWISYGSGMLHMSMVTGMKSIIISKLDSKKMPNYLMQYQPQWLAGVPAHYRIINDSELIKKNGVPFLVAGAVGGDAMSSDLYESVNQFLLDHGAKQGVYPGYALTESTSAFAVKQLGNFKSDSVGIPLPGGTMGIFEFNEETEQTTDNELDYNERGEICLKTPNMMVGYFQNNELTSEVLVKHSDGSTWIHTGDLGHIDSDGFLFVDGRIKEMITRHDGFKVYPSLIERVINSCNGVSSSKVVGIHDCVNGDGNVPRAFITIKEEFQEQTERILSDAKKRCEQCLPEYYNEGMEYEVIEKLPLTGLGKVDFRELQSRASQLESPKIKKLERIIGKRQK